VAKDVRLHRQPGCWLRSSHTFKECVIAHWSSDLAPKISGAQIWYRSCGLERVVEERSVWVEAIPEGVVDYTEVRMLA
jgi:hypothetical protein